MMNTYSKFDGIDILKMVLVIMLIVRRQQNGFFSSGVLDK